MKLSITLIATLLACTLSAKNSSPYQVIKNRHSLENSNIPSYMEFAPESRPKAGDLYSIFASYFKKDNNFSFVEIGREKGQLGFTHIRYEQTYKGDPIELAEVIAHIKNGEIYSVNGKLIDMAPSSSNNSLEETVALQKAMDYVGANSYKWQLFEEQAHLKLETGNHAASYFPTAELKYISSQMELNPSELRLAYKFNIYAHDPMSRQDVYVDAVDGSILFTNNRIHTANVSGTATTAYSGVQSITTDSTGTTSFRLRQTVSGSGVYTFNMLTGTSYVNSVDFTDTDNNWNNVNAQKDQYATDAHWGAESTHDYLMIKHGRNSINGNGFALNSYLHYGNNFNNAFWDGQRMTYGDGSGATTPFCALDVAGHEICHGLTTFTADLIYASESGALNESFSDIFGAAVEFFARPSRANWTIGEDIGSLRSMSNPGAYNDPDTRTGINWINQNCTPTRFNDQCGVHTNSGVQNFWFYLLTQGGVGTNDLGNAYSVVGRGIDTAAAVAFRNLTVYLTQSSDYDDARFFAIQSAIDLYGACSPQVESVTNAWHAVGVGAVYTSAVTSTFSADFTDACLTPLITNFTNTSSNGINFTWDFGDGNSSTVRNPIHTYTTYGQFDVKLVTDGGACGIDSTTQISYIDVDTSNACLVVLQNGTNTTQTSCTGKIFDTGGPTGDYSNGDDATITISPTNAASVTLTFISFDVEAGAGSSCNYDYVEVYDGASIFSPLLGRYCNNNIPTTVSSTVASITVRFFADGGATEAGFEFDWSCNPATTSPTADFSSNVSSSCDGLIDFSDISTQAPSAWAWDFGDGNTSNAQHPTHNYTANGTFNVKLKVTNSFGIDSISKSNFVSINRPNRPTVVSDTVCIGQAANLSASAPGVLSWYTSETGGTSIATGSSLNVANITRDSTLWVESFQAAPIQVVGPTSNTIGSGNNFSNGQVNHHLVFDVFEKITLVSVRVYPGSAGNRTIELRDSNDVVLQSFTRFIPASTAFRVTLNFVIQPGTNYKLGVSAGNGPDLYRNNSGVSYPYTISNKVSIKRSSAGSNPVGFYYFFYNWRIKSDDCLSARESVIAYVDNSCSIVGLNETDELEDGILVYPNPASSLFHINYNGMKELRQLSVRDLTGKLIHQENVNSTNSIKKLNVADWSDGVYFLQFETANSSIVKKIIVSHK